MNNKLKPALLGGLVTGILSVIPIVSTCCCLWAIAGGMLAAFLYIRSSAAPVATGEGAIIGVMSGVVGAIIYLIIGLPLALFVGVAGMDEQFRRAGVEIPFTGTVLVLISVCIAVVVILICSTLGGVIGVAVFEKRKGTPPPAPPQGFGG